MTFARGRRTALANPLDVVAQALDERVHRVAVARRNSSELVFSRDSIRSISLSLTCLRARVGLDIRKLAGY